MDWFEADFRTQLYYLHEFADNPDDDFDYRYFDEHANDHEAAAKDQQIFSPQRFFAKKQNKIQLLTVRKSRFFMPKTFGPIEIIELFAYIYFLQKINKWVLLFSL